MDKIELTYNNELESFDIVSSFKMSDKEIEYMKSFPPYYDKVSFYGKKQCDEFHVSKCRVTQLFNSKFFNLSRISLIRWMYESNNQILDYDFIINDVYDCKEEVIYRQTNDMYNFWTYGIFSHYENTCGSEVAVINGQKIYLQSHTILPYKGNEKLVGTNQEVPKMNNF